MIKAAFFDVDGTLLSHKTKQVPPSARAAIARLQEQGIRCILATGRQMGALEKLPVGDIPFDAYLTLNGQLMLDAEKNVTFGVPITGKAREYLVEKFRDHTYPALLIEERASYVNFINDYVRYVQEVISTPMPPVGVYDGAEIYQICAYLRPEEGYLLDPIAEDCLLFPSFFGGWDVIAKGGGKRKGIQRYLEESHILPDEIIAFGDGENDREMLMLAGIGVAMGNAEDGVKEIADYVTTDVDADGIARALRHFGLIE